MARRQMVFWGHVETKLTPGAACKSKMVKIPYLAFYMATPTHASGSSDISYLDTKTN